MKRIILSALLAWGLAPALAQQDFPNRPVTIVVATPAGGVTDKVVRVIGRSLQTQWGRPIVIENRPGASGNIASQHVAKAAPDGYTLLVSAGPFAINPALFRSLPFDTRKDFEPIGLMGSFSSVLLVHESFPAKTYAEFATLAKNPAQPVSVASPGNGTAQHLAMELLRNTAKLNLNHIPYKGGAPAITDLLAGHVKVMMSGMGDASPQLSSGKIRPLALTGKSRSPLLPHIPTFTELGVMDFDASGWMGLHAPTGTPAPIIAKINRDLSTALADPAVRQAMTTIEVEPRPTTLPEFRQFMDTQFAKWKEAVDLSGAKVD